MQTTFLAPVAKPRGPFKKLIYAFCRRQFGMVSTPISVFAARMPASFMSFYGKLSRLDKKLVLPARTAVVIRERVASLNACLYCMDAARWLAVKQSADNGPRFDALDQYRTSSLFADSERAALDYATELVTDKRVEAATFARLREHYTEREICDIVWLVASEHLYNVTNIGLNIGSDGMCELRPPR
jgi:alkylhydroperoxidase family enzyme